MAAEKENVALLFGGNGTEAKVSADSAELVQAALQRKGYTVQMINVASEGWIQAIEEDAIALVMVHGDMGENGQCQAMLDQAGIPYTGTNAASSGLMYDKILTKHLWRSVGGLTSEYLRFDLDTYEEVANHILAGFSEVILPLVVKPAEEGSSNAVYIVRTQEELLPAMEAVLQAGEIGLAETMLDGAEFTLGFIDDDFLGATEIVAPGGVYDFEAKYESDATTFVEFEPDWDLQELVATCRKLITLARLEGPLRFDFRMYLGRPYLLEVNTVPGMTSHSLLPMTAAQAGIGYDELVASLVQGARSKR